MKKILLISALPFNLAFAGGQEGTGSIPDDGTIVGTSSLDDGQNQLVCFKQVDLNKNETVSCIVIQKDDKN